LNVRRGGRIGHDKQPSSLSFLLVFGSVCGGSWPGFSGLLPAKAAGYNEDMATPTTNPTTPAPVPNLGDYIVKTSGVCSRQPRIAGTRIKVKHIYTWVECMGMTPAQVVAEYPQLTMAQVHAALAYYWSNQEEIHQDIENEEKLIAALKAKAAPSKIPERVADQDATDNPLPPR
jgi:uncharacterized protein (DUF433 family)